jgi:hypothetical protein
VKEQRRKMRKEETVTIDLLHRTVPARHTDKGLGALNGQSSIHPESVQKYLEGKFGDALEDVSKARLALAKPLLPPQLAEKAYRLYEKFRPEIPKKGWGPPASWTWSSSAGCLRPKPGEQFWVSYERGAGEDLTGNPHYDRTQLQKKRTDNLTGNVKPPYL